MKRPLRITCRTSRLKVVAAAASGTEESKDMPWELVVMATVKGDAYDIGKNIVGVVLWVQ